MPLPHLLGSLLRAVSIARLVPDDRLPYGVQYARPIVGGRLPSGLVVPMVPEGSVTIVMRRSRYWLETMTPPSMAGVSLRTRSVPGTLFRWSSSFAQH